MALSKGDTKNACAKHQVEHHQGEPWDFGMRILRSHKFPLRRQTHEGRLVEDFKGDMILNQKGEWGCNLQPNLIFDQKQPNKR